ncbi:MAG: hypothetical protein KU37_09290 [Sulfuricurvum sp. PC08-66]|nr:MAG: hypothetical protein KU37_09290 [Sulfuricurvum sp. PC08-66]
MTKALEIAYAQGDVATLYEAYHARTLDAKGQEQLMAMLIESAQEALHEKIVTQTPFMMRDRQAHYVLRTLYEIAMASYEASNSVEAQEQFALLGAASDDAKFSLAMRHHLCALLMEMEYEAFVGECAVIEEEENFYIDGFSSICAQRCKTQEKRIETFMAPMVRLFGGDN